MKKVVVEGKTVKEAIEAGLRKLKAQKQEVKIRVLRKPQKSFLGLLRKKARVELEYVGHFVEHALQFLQELLAKMNLDAEVQMEKVVNRRNIAYIHIKGEELGRLIGRKGRTLDALEHLVNLVTRKRVGRKFLFIHLDVNGYRKSREEFLVQWAKQLAEEVIEKKKSMALDPMPAYERKIIHRTLQKWPHVQTHSEGKEPDRYVVIEYTER